MRDNYLRVQPDGSFKCSRCGKENLRGIVQCAEHYDLCSPVFDYDTPISFTDIEKTLKVWEAAKPKFVKGSEPGKLIIYGTKSPEEMINGKTYFRKLWDE